MTKPDEEETQHRRQLSHRQKESTARMEDFLPLYLRRYVYPYHGDFFFSKVYDPMLMAQLMCEGFLPIATPDVVLPKLHRQRCVVHLQGRYHNSGILNTKEEGSLHVSRSTRKKAKRFHLTVNRAFQEVVAGCQKQHGGKCWLYPPLVDVFEKMHKSGGVIAKIFDSGGSVFTGRGCPVRMYSIEVWNATTDQLVGGELGYTVGSIYTSLTGFSCEDSAGSVQLAALGRMLQSLGFSLWDMGMEMDYKRALGGTLMPRKEFVAHVHAVRETCGSLVLPAVAADGKPFQAKTLIDEGVQNASTLR